MKTVLFTVLALALLPTAFILYKEYLRRRMLTLASEKFLSVRPLMQKLRDNKAVSGDEILMILKDPSLRLAIFRIMQAHNKMDLFPEQYYTCEKGAETFLVNWLEYPTELGTAPDHIEFLTKITFVETVLLDYYVFKFTVNSPHWAAKEWMLGTCGPYDHLTLPYDIPLRVFSRFNAFGSISPETEVQWVHANINKHG